MELKDRVYSTQGWIMKNRAMIILIIVILYALFATKSCLNQLNKKIDLIEAIKDKESKITYWIDKAGKEHANVKQVQGSLETIKAVYQGKLDSAAKQLGVKEKQITEYIEIVKTTKGKFHTKIDSFYTYVTIPGDSVPVKVVDYLGANYKDKWLNFEAKIKDGGFDAKYSIHDSLIIIGYWKKTGFLHLGKKDYYLDISSENPNSYIENVKNFKVTSEKPRKWGVGLIGGYGTEITNLKFKPYVGIGLYYRLF